MWDLVALVLVPAVPAAFGVVLWMDHHRRRWRQGWERVAERLGLELAPLDRWGPPAAATLAGLVEERACAIDVSVGRHQPVTARVLLAVKAGPPEFVLALEREGLASRLEKLAGATELELNDPAFDRRYMVRTSDRERARRLLDRTTRAALLATELDRVTVTPEGVGVEVRASPWSSAERLADRTTGGVQAAAALARRAETLAGPGQKGAKRARTGRDTSAPVATETPTLARAVKPALSLLGVALILGGLSAFRVWQDHAAARRAEEVNRRVEVVALSGEISRLAMHRHMREMTRSSWLTPEREELLSDTETGRRIVEMERRRTAADAREAAAEPTQIAQLQDRIRGHLARQPDPERSLRELEEQVRERGFTATSGEVEQALHDVLDGVRPAPLGPAAGRQ